jgi:hypothetical protein
MITWNYIPFSVLPVQLTRPSRPVLQPTRPDREANLWQRHLCVMAYDKVILDKVILVMVYDKVILGVYK